MRDQGRIGPPRPGCTQRNSALARHHQELFEEELNGWYTDSALWHRDRSLKVLRQWCSFELHSVVVDTGSSALEDDE